MAPEYIVEAKSRKDLRNAANSLRNLLGLKDVMRIPIVEVLEIMPIIFDGFSFEIVPDDYWSDGKHAETDISSGHITILESVYDNACDGKGRDRMTIAHEIGHYFTFCHCGFKLQSNIKHEPVQPFFDPEWQAKCFAGEFMISHKLTKNMSCREIANQCGVSLAAANYQYTHRN